MKVLGCIIAGGKSSRMGQDKAFIEWRGKTLIDHVADRLQPQVDLLIINTNSDPRHFKHLVIPDRIVTDTPLAGIHAALTYATEIGFDAVLTSPCDTPMIPLDLRQRLEGKGAAIAVSGSEEHYIHGFWPVGTLPLIADCRRAMDFADMTHARHVEWSSVPSDPFLNINTPKDVSELP